MSNEMSIKQIRKLMADNGRKADELHQKALDDHCDGLLNPTSWIYNQNTMRPAWEKYRKKYEYDEKDTQAVQNMKRLMLNNSFGRYMNFMYENWPSGFADECTLAYKTKTIFDGAETYKRLAGNREN